MGSTYVLDFPPNMEDQDSSSNLEDGEFWLPIDLCREINEWGGNNNSDDEFYDDTYYSNQFASLYSPPPPYFPPPPSPPFIFPMSHINGATESEVYGNLPIRQWSEVIPAYRNKFPDLGYYPYYSARWTTEFQFPPTPFPFYWPDPLAYHYTGSWIGISSLPAARTSPPGTGVFFPLTISTSYRSAPGPSRTSGTGVYHVTLPKMGQ